MLVFKQLFTFLKLALPLNHRPQMSKNFMLNCMKIARKSFEKYICIKNVTSAGDL